MTKYPFCGLKLLDEKLGNAYLKPTNHRTIEVPNVFDQRIRKPVNNTLGFNVINAHSLSKVKTVQCYRICLLLARAFTLFKSCSTCVIPDLI